MKKNLFFILVTFLLFSYSQSNLDKIDDLIINYQLDFRKNIDSEKVRSENMILIINQEKGAIFTFEKMINLDSIQKLRPLDMADAMSNKLSSYYFIARSNDSIIHYEVIGNDLLKFNESLNLNWELTSETKNISGYACKKAVLEYAGRSWIAWYAPKISVSQGPYKFYGLPGLIFEIYDSEKIFSFNINEIKSGSFDINDSVKNYFITEENDNFQSITRKDFLMIREKYHQMSLNEKLKYMNRNKEGTHDFVVTGVNGESINTKRKPKTKNFIERRQE
ncbi:GLPGLI family protein [uncultured Winogradskyella sp.]|uniref:GLPGLI family protein n=1 Tax=uncultured Winogradskyella sp. TaxID=395353 RepID=UPI0030D950CF|tara:strand:+ start:55008 stop:55841 length:834 start_codon:yes stop_codon:yes gene_type:complete